MKLLPPIPRYTPEHQALIDEALEYTKQVHQELARAAGLQPLPSRVTATELLAHRQRQTPEAIAQFQRACADWNLHIARQIAAIPVTMFIPDDRTATSETG